MVCAALGIQFLLDLANLPVHLWMVYGEAITARYSGARAVMVSSAVIPSRAFLHEEHTEDHNCRPNESDTHGKAPRAGALLFLCSEIDAIGGEYTQGDKQLQRVSSASLLRAQQHT